jgi:hypothetical protein
MAATRRATSVQRAAFRAGNVHGTCKEVGQSGTHAQDENQQANLEKRVAHESSASTPRNVVGPLYVAYAPKADRAHCFTLVRALRSGVTIHWVVVALRTPSELGCSFATRAAAP